MNHTIKNRLTKQRKVIFEELCKVDTHPTADEVYGMVRKRLPNISLGTVYRNLDLLSETGKIQKLDTTGSLRRFDGNPNPHLHVRCLNCGRMADIPENDILVPPPEKFAVENFAITGVYLICVGQCKRCSDNMKTVNLKDNQKTI